MDEFKKNFSKVIAASADDDKSAPNGENFVSEGGASSLNIGELLQKYGLTADDVDFETDGMSEEEIEARFAEIKKVKYADEGDGESEEPEGDGDGDDQGDGGQDGDGEGEGGEDDPEPEEDDNDDAPGGTKQQFGLTGMQLRDGIMDALRAVCYVDEWGEWPRYCIADYDPAVSEVYVYDNDDWNLYGFKYHMNGDNVVIDFDTKKRMKLAFVEFDNGDAQFSYEHMFDSANARFEAVTKEVVALREFKKQIDENDRKAKIESVFARFEDIFDDDSFKSLKENCSDMSIQDIEDKCFAIRGRKVQVKFSQNSNPVRLPIEVGSKNVDVDEPYGGIFVEFGIGNR